MRLSLYAMLARSNNIFSFSLWFVLSILVWAQHIDNLPLVALAYSFIHDKYQSSCHTERIRREHMALAFSTESNNIYIPPFIFP